MRLHRLSSFLVALPLLLPGVLLGIWAAVLWSGARERAFGEEENDARHFLQRFRDTLPEHWKACALEAIKRRSVVILEFSADGQRILPFQTSDAVNFSAVGETVSLLQESARVREARGQPLEALGFFAAARSQGETLESTSRAAEVRAYCALNRYSEALTALDEAAAAGFKSTLFQLLRVRCLLHLDSAKAADFVRDWLSGPLGFPDSTLPAVLTHLDERSCLPKDLADLLRVAATISSAPEDHGPGLHIGTATLAEFVPETGGTRLILWNQTHDASEAAVQQFAAEGGPFSLSLAPHSAAIHRGTVDLLGQEVFVVPKGLSAAGRWDEISRFFWAGSIVAVFFGAVVSVIVLRQKTKLSDLKSHFVDVVSHELRTPLTALSLRVEMLARGDVPAEKQRKYLGELYVEVGRMNDLVHQLLDFARLERGGRRIECAPASIRTVIAPVLRTCRFSLRHAGLRVRTVIPRNLPLVMMDQSVMSRALRNLIENAWKYAAAGRVVEIRANAVKSAMILSVRDFGPGLSSGDTDSLFEPFRRGPKTAGIPGSGLGLVMVAFAARAHGGRVTARTHPEGGAEFTLQIPLGKDHYGLAAHR